MRAFFDPTQLAHDPKFFLVRGQVRPNFETPARASALAGVLDPVLPGEAGVEAGIAAIHPADYTEFLRTAPAAWDALGDRGPELVANMHPAPEMQGSAQRPAHVVGQLGWYTADAACPITAATWPASRAAAACALASADSAAQGNSAYALCRPPGHHAYGARAGGHCYLNNAAIAAERLRARGAARVAVLDIDAHHGNGTQHLFWEREDVAVASLHGDPHGYYPWFVGHADERGAGAGSGCNLNLPLARGTGDAAWLAALDTALRQIRRWHVDALVVSLGFDASVHEPLTFLAVGDDAFARAGAAIAALGRPAAIVQEGGYAVDHLGRLLQRFLDGWASPT